MTNLNLYRIFCEVAKQKNITKASEALFVSQPSVSSAIKELETSIGGQLFIRQNKGVVLTSYGQDIYNKIRGFRPWAFCYLKVRNQFLQINHAQIINLSQTSFMVKNKKYRMPDLYYSEKAGRVLAKGKDWLLCSTIDSEHAILLYDVKLYGFCKGILTKHFIKQLRFIK